MEGLAAPGVKKKFALKIDDEDEIILLASRFFRDNSELDARSKREIRKLKVGEKTWGGGGAATRWHLTRIT
jgi:hypothetical protein